MLRTLPLFLALLLTSVLGTRASAQTPQAENMTLLGSWNASDVSRYNDVWGYAANGREFALIGSRQFIHIVEVTDPSNPQELHRVNAYSASSTWRDIKMLGQYAYCATEGMEGLQVIDLGNVAAPTSSVSVVYTNDIAFRTCHNLEIDYESTPAKLYAFGTDTERGGYVVFSLADPANPALLASIQLGSSGRYIHDGHAVGDVLYANSASKGMYVYDVSNPAAPVELGLLDNYQEQGYNHSSWRTPDGRHLILCDETTDTGVKILDVSDPADIQVKSIFRSAFSNPDSQSSLAHNPLVISNDRVVLSYYGDGIQIWEFSDPENPTRVSYYDTTPGSLSYTNGVWGAYPYLPSGNILGSDMSNGLFIVREGGALPVTYSHWAASTDGKNAMLDWTVATELDNAGWTVEHAEEQGAFSDLGFVPAGRTDNSFFHESPGPGTHYYRLRQRDFDGTEIYSEVRTVSFAGDERRALTFPNPAAPGTELTFKGLTDRTDWSLWSVSGRQVAVGRGRYASFNVPAGAYLLKVGNAIVDRVVIQD